MRVSLAEDDAALADVIARGLRREALSVDIAGDGATASSGPARSSTTSSSSIAICR